MKPIPILLIAALITFAAIPAVAASPDLLISIDCGNLHFPGETAGFYITITANGALVNPDSVNATLYLPSNINSIALTLTNVGTGVYWTSYAVPSDAVTGFYGLVVTASYQSGSFRGSAVKGFEVSQGLSDMQDNLLLAIGGLSDQFSSVETNILTAVSTATASTNALVGSVNSSLSGQLTSTSTQVASFKTSVDSNFAGVTTSISSLSTSVTNMGSSLQSSLTSAISTSQGAITTAVNNGASGTQTAVGSAKDSVISAVNAANGPFSASTSQSFKDVQNWEYIIMVLALVSVVLSVILLVRRK